MATVLERLKLVGTMGLGAPLIILLMMMMMGVPLPPFVLDLFFTGTLPDGEDYRFRNVFLYTVRDGKFVRLVEVASKEMWAFLAEASQKYGAR